jgi:magnesium transporter
MSDHNANDPSEKESTTQSSESHHEQMIQTEDQSHFFKLSSNWSAFTHQERIEKFSSLPRTEAEELFYSLSVHDQAELISEASPLEKRSWVRLLGPDDVADLIQELGLERKDEILNLLDNQTRREVSALLAYAEDRAGGLMNSRFARLRPEMTVDEAISYLRIQAKAQVEIIYYAYVLDVDQTLLGVVSFRELFSTPQQKLIKEVMRTDLVKVPIQLNQEQVARVFQKSDLLAIPVIDEWGHMKGIVTYDDVANVLQEEATEDIQKIGGVEALDTPYLKATIYQLVRKRAVWLMVLFVGEMLTSNAMSFYGHAIEKAVVLAFFIPLIISSGGNSGSQASTLIIRAMALGEVRLKDWWRVLGREVVAGLMLGVLLGLVGMLRIWFIPPVLGAYDTHIGPITLTVGFSVMFVVLWGAISGSMLPFALKRFKLDPAAASAPFVATLVDVTGLVIYFSIASFILEGKMV